MFILFVSLFFTISSCEHVNKIRLEYKFIPGKSLAYCEVQTVERHDFEKHLDESFEFLEMNYTEQIIEVESMKMIQRIVNSLRMYPYNQQKYKQLTETTNRKVNNPSTTHSAELSSYLGRLLLLPPNEPNFPLDEIYIGNEWVIPIVNSFGNIKYRLTDIIENQIARIVLEGDLDMNVDASLTGTWTFDVQRGVTLAQETLSSSSTLYDCSISKKIKKTLISIM